MTDTPDCDVLIVGAGPVGMTLQRALAAGGLTARLIERRAHAALREDPRALALSHGARQLLEQLGAWPAARTTAIETIHISQKGGFGRTRLDRTDYGLPGLGYVVRYGDIAAALAQGLTPDVLLESTELLGQHETADGLAVTVRQQGEERLILTRLLIHAEGTPGESAGVRVSDYQQHAVICEVTPHPTTPAPAGRPAHDHVAWERFTPDGPLALLPLGGQYSVVFTLPPAKADAVMALDDDAFLAALQAQFGPRLRFSDPTPRFRFPLALRLRDTLVQGRQAWIGNTAQTLHPVSGQGFNLGLRDAWQLAERLLAAGPTPAALARYPASRRLDRQGGALFTDGIVRLFSNDLPPLRLARGLGLLALDLCPPARHFVARRMIWGARAWP